VLLLFDADDTLWENNVYFERVIARFMQRLNHSQLAVAEIRARLNAIEHENIVRFGYGVHSFARALCAAYSTLAEAPPDAAALEDVRTLALTIAHEPIELLPAVVETLAALQPRHRMALVTKGDFAEQTSKLERSGLAPHFERVFVLPEKTAAAYRETVLALTGDPATTWMIGNSPRSDINPALAAGLRAVLVRHPDTWILEHEALAPAPAGHLIEVESFAALQKLF